MSTGNKLVNLDALKAVNDAMQGQVNGLKSALLNKQDAPASAGTEGQVLSLDGNLDPVWTSPNSGKQYEFIRRVIFGYSVLTNEPEDWSTNWTDYYENTGTAKLPVYSQLTGESAPTFVTGTYFEYSTSQIIGDTTIMDVDGNNFALDDVYVALTSAANDSLSANSYWALKFYNRNNPGIVPIVSVQLGAASAGKAVARSFAELVNNNGLLTLYYSSSTRSDDVKYKDGLRHYAFYNANGTLSRSNFPISYEGAVGLYPYIACFTLVANSQGIIPGSTMDIYGTRRVVSA